MVVQDLGVRNTASEFGRESCRVVTEHHSGDLWRVRYLGLLTLNFHEKPNSTKQVIHVESQKYAYHINPLETIPSFLPLSLLEYDNI